MARERNILTREQFHELFKNSGCKQKDLVDHFKVSITTVSRAFRKGGVWLIPLKYEADMIAFLKQKTIENKLLDTRRGICSLPQEEIDNKNSWIQKLKEAKALKGLTGI